MKRLKFYQYIEYYSLAFLLLCLVFPQSVNALAGPKVRDAKPSDNLGAIVKISGGTGVLVAPNIILTAGHVPRLNNNNSPDRLKLDISFPESKQPERAFKVIDTKAAERGIFPTRYLDHSDC